MRAGDAAPSWHTTFAQAVRELRGVEIPADAFDDSRLPPHLRMTFRVVEERRGGAMVLDEGPDLVALQRRLAAQSEQAMRSAMRDALRSGHGRAGRPARGHRDHGKHHARQHRPARTPAPRPHPPRARVPSRGTTSSAPA